MISHCLCLEFFRVQDEVPLEYLSTLFCHRMHSNILGKHILFLISIFFKMPNPYTEGDFSKPSGQPVETMCNLSSRVSIINASVSFLVQVCQLLAKKELIFDDALSLCTKHYLISSSKPPYEVEVL